MNKKSFQWTFVPYILALLFFVFFIVFVIYREVGAGLLMGSTRAGGLLTPVISVGGSIPSGTPGSILFVTPSATIGQDNTNLFWDDGNDRFGIGSSSPWGSLSVEHPATNTPSHPAFVVSDQGTSTPSFIVLNRDGFVGIATRTPGSLFSVNNGSVNIGGVLTLENNFKTSFLVATSTNTYSGFGTTTPGALLSVNGSILAQTGTSTFGGLISPSLFSTTSLNFYTSSNAASRLLINTSGNVGIGTTSPAESLTVGGNFQISQANATLGQCGTSGGEVKGSSVGLITVGGGAPTTCNIIFNTAFNNPPVCVANDDSAIVALQVVASSTGLQISASAAFNGAILSYICIGK